MSSLRKSLAIDLGTSEVLVYVSGQGIVCKEPSVIVKDVLTNRILAVGKRAEDMLGRAPGNVLAFRPLKNGVIADFDSTEKMLEYFLKRSVKKSFLAPDCLICVPTRANQVEKKALIQAGQKAGFHKISLIDEPLAAAIGAGVDVADVGGNLVVDIGGGTCDVAVISLGRIVVSNSINLGGNKINEAIKDYMRERYGLLIGERTSERAKIEASRKQANDSVEIVGRQIQDGLPSNIIVPIDKIYNRIEPILDKVVETVRELMEKTPPELAADIYDRGIILTGGAAKTLGLSDRLSEKFQMPVVIAQAPDECVINGCAKALSIVEKIERESNSQVKFKQKQLEKNEKLRRR